MNKAIRLIGFKYFSIKLLFDYYGLLNFENMIKINQGKLMWKLVNKEEPECSRMKNHLQEIYSLNKNKDENRYILSHFRTNIGKFYLHYQGTYLWKY